MEKVITKIYDNGNRKAVIKVELSDPCHNGHNDFAITAELYVATKNGRWKLDVLGACHDEIIKACPELAEFIPLHVAEENGKPLYYFANTIYWYYEKGLDEAAKYMRVSKDLAEKVLKDYEAHEDKSSPYCKENQDLWDKVLTKYGIFAQWQKEADKLKAFIQEK